MGKGNEGDSMNVKKGDEYWYFWKRVFVLSVLYGMIHLAGFRVYTAIWAGTHTGEVWTGFAGMLYIILYLGWITVVPIYAIAGLIMWLKSRIHKMS